MEQAREVNIRTLRRKTANKEFADKLTLGGTGELGSVQHKKRYTVRWLEPLQPDSAQEVACNLELFPFFYTDLCSISTIV